MATNRDNDVGRLAVCNATPFVWKLSENKKHRMPVWQFPRSVNPGETVTARVKFGKDGGGNGGPTGEATYRVEVGEDFGDEGEHTVAIKANHDGVKLDLSGNMKRQKGWYAVPVPPHKVAPRGWQQGCLVSCTLGFSRNHPNLRGADGSRGLGDALASLNPPPDIGPENRDHDEVFPHKKDDTEDSCERGLGKVGVFFQSVGRKLQEATDGVNGLLTDCGVVAPGRPSGGSGEGKWTANWMRIFGPALEDLKLSELSIPGTHDSGANKFHNPIVNPWASTQDLNIEEQMLAGVRALDLRVGFVGDGDDGRGVHDRLAIVHDKYRTKTSLRRALQDVKSFVTDHDSEIILLDFHRFPNLGHGPPHEAAAVVVLDVLREARDPLFWPGIRQAWNDSKTLSSLHQLATNELAEKKNPIWSFPLVLPPNVPRPVPHIPAHVDDWMVVGGIWQHNANIVSVDFIQETQIVRNCISASLLKAMRDKAS